MGKKHVIVFIFLAVALSGKLVFAQNDTTFLSEVSVVEKRSSQFAVGSEIMTLDSATLQSYQGQNLSDMLSLESPVYIKYYSPGNLASTSFRGANAQQTALTWNGFNINSPLNGQFDLSLFPAEAFDEVKIQPGASSALWGSGAMGGSVHLGHRPDFTKHLEFQAGFQAGSFGFHYEMAGIDFGSRKSSNRLILVNRYAENDFTYRDPYTGREETQTNNQVNTQGLLSENYFRAGNKDLFSLNLWLQKSDRNIPPAIFEKSLSSQQDDVLRLTSEWFHDFKKSELKIRGAWFNEKQNFKDLRADTLYFNNSQAFIGEAEWSINLNASHHFDLGFNHTTFLADVQSFQTDALWQNRDALFGGYRWEILDGLHFSAMLRQEMIDQDLVPFTYTFGLNWSFHKNFRIKAQFSRIYRAPTLNDLYWIPGGNSNLNPEKGLAQDLTASWEAEKSRFRWRVSASAFNRNVGNWILWISRNGISTPLNLREVWSRGLEIYSFAEWQKGQWLFRINLGTNYIVSTNEKAITSNDASVGKQLIYTPVYSGNAGFTVVYRRFSVRYHQSYTGYTYTLADHSEYLEPYQLADLYLAYNPTWQKFGGNLFLRINNLWDESYQVVRNRPMPGLHFNLGINLNFKINHQK